MKEFRWYVQPFWYNTRVWRTDRQTGLAWHICAIAYYAVARKNWYWPITISMSSFLFCWIHSLWHTFRTSCVDIVIVLSFIFLSIELFLYYCKLGMFSVNRLTEKISVNRFSINRTETENGGQDGVMQNAHIAVHHYRWCHRFDFRSLDAASFSRSGFSSAQQNALNNRMMLDRHITVYLLFYQSLTLNMMNHTRS